MIGRYVSELASETDDTKPLFPLSVRYVTDHLHHGKFHGLGYQQGRKWILDDHDIVAIKERMRPEQPIDLDRPSGVSSRSRTFTRAS